MIAIPRTPPFISATALHLFLRLTLIPPFLWGALFFYILVSGSLSLGYIPSYGDHRDPFSLGLDPLVLLLVLTTLCVLVILPLVGLVLLVYAVVNPAAIRFAKWPLICFLLVITTEQILRWSFSGQYNWVFD
jgi:hypothetical protein